MLSLGRAVTGVLLAAFAWWTHAIASSGLRLFFPTWSPASAAAGLLGSSLASSLFGQVTHPPPEEHALTPLWRWPSTLDADSSVRAVLAVADASDIFARTPAVQPHVFVDTADAVKAADWSARPNGTQGGYLSSMATVLEASVNLTTSSARSPFLHAIFCRTGKPCPADKYTAGMDLSKSRIDVDDILYFRLPLTTLQRPTNASASNGAPPKPEPHFQPRVTLHLVNINDVFAASPAYGVPMPGDLVGSVRFSQAHARKFLPVLYYNPLEVRTDENVALGSGGHADAGERRVTLTVTLKLTPLGLFRAYLHLQGTFAQFTAPEGLLRMPEEELDGLRTMFFQTDPWLLMLVMVFSMLHLLLDALAFQEDISFWRSKTDVQAVSKTTLALEMACKFVIFFYLYEKKNNTSVLVWGIAGITAVVELWKFLLVLRRARASSRKPQHASSSPSNGDKSTSSAVSEKERVTREVDALALKYLGLPLIPVCALYALYTWYFHGSAYPSVAAVVLESLSALAYTLEFVLMTPQLIVNHRLRSVEAMNVLVFFYRAFNTIVDDVFAFVIPMPPMARVGTLRDDVIFVILLWQMWRYPRRSTKKTAKTNEVQQRGDNAKKNE